MPTKKLYIIAGCNGAGKTTASFTILPEILKCKEFVNADEIARGLSPFQPEKVAIDAARIMIERIKELIQENQNFAFETTLSSRSHRNKIIEAKKKEYKITMLFFWLRTVELAKKRVKIRVSEGGHNVETNVIERRYYKGVRNLFDLYLPIVDVCYLFDNSEGVRQLVAKKEFTNFAVTDQNKFDLLKQQYDQARTTEKRR